MKIRLWMHVSIAALLVSCDKPKSSGDSASADGSTPQATRASGPSRDAAPSKRQRLRESLNAAKQIESVEARDEALAEVARNALEIAPDLAAEAVKQLSSDSQKKMPLLRDCVKRLIAKDPDGALAWVASLGSERDIAAAKAEIALILVGSDPERAANLISPTDLADGKTNSTAMQVLQQWTAVAPADAAAWVINAPEDETRKAGIKAVVSRWALGDTPAALAWMDKLPEGSTRKEAARSVAEALANQPAPIRELLLGPVDPAVRSELEQQIEQVTQEKIKAIPRPFGKPPAATLPEPVPEPDAVPQSQPQPDPATP
ncbi:MAG: hypothetical protein WCK77_07710 [Verrucomicrobiota bacterium]